MPEKCIINDEKGGAAIRPDGESGFPHGREARKHIRRVLAMA